MGPDPICHQGSPATYPNTPRLYERHVSQSVTKGAQLGTMMLPKDASAGLATHLCAQTPQLNWQEATEPLAHEANN
jgi:hypothetical protein